MMMMILMMMIRRRRRRMMIMMIIRPTGFITLYLSPFLALVISNRSVNTNT
jgi:hypothetical protein